MKAISEQLVNMRKGAGATQKDIAKCVGLTIGAICNYEKGRRPIRAEHFEKIKYFCHKIIKLAPPPAE